MTIITAAELNIALDRCAQIIASLRGPNVVDVYSLSQGYGIGPSSSFGALKGIADLKTEIISNFTGNDAMDVVNSFALALENQLTADMWQGYFVDLISKLNRHVVTAQVSTVTNLSTYLSYLNYGAGGTNTALQNALIQELMSDMGITTYQGNTYFEVLQNGYYQGTNWTNGMGKLSKVAGTPTTTLVTTPFSQTLYAGGVAKLKVASITGSGVVTVTGKVWNPATQAVTSSSTWTVTASAATTYTLAPAVTNGLLIEVTAISAAAGITDMVAYVESHRPSGRLQILP